MISAFVYRRPLSINVRALVIIEFATQAASSNNFEFAVFGEVARCFSCGFPTRRPDVDILVIARSAV